MVRMLDGTATEFQPQVAEALFGYMVGIATAVSCFIFGRHVYEWFKSCHLKTYALDDAVSTADSADHSVYTLQSLYDTASSVVGTTRNLLLGIRCAPVILLAALFSAFVVGDAVHNIPFYRYLWISTLMTPFGAILRWRLSEWNTRKRKRWEWFPWGTFTSNIVAAIIALAADALYTRFIAQDAGMFPWVGPVLQAVEVGFAGSLSTVSTLIREIVCMATPRKSLEYTLTTTLCAMLIGLAVYSPIVRSA
jgi:fluoride ion exporter CrcB/FEX